MCGSKQKAPLAMPAPAQPTKFEYVNADMSNAQQKQAAIMSSTNQQPASFGSELGSAALAAPNAAQGVA